MRGLTKRPMTYEEAVNLANFYGNPVIVGDHEKLGYYLYDCSDDHFTYCYQVSDDYPDLPYADWVTKRTFYKAMKKGHPIGVIPPHLKGERMQPEFSLDEIFLAQEIIETG